MINILLYVGSMVLAIVLLSIFVMILGSDIYSSIMYIKSDKITGTVLDYICEHRVGSYGRGQQDTVYYAYNVQYIVNGVTYQGKYLSRKKTLHNGDMVEVHYCINDDGTSDILNRHRLDRLKRFGVAFIFGIILVFVILIFKIIYNW